MNQYGMTDDEYREFTQGQRGSQPTSGPVTFNGDSGGNSGGSSNSYQGYTLPPGVTQEQAADFISRNPGDYARLSSAFRPTGDRSSDSQGPDYDQATNSLTSAALQQRLAGAGPNASGDLDYWQKLGIASTDISDPTTRQLRPGWVRTANGYAYQPQAGQAGAMGPVGFQNTNPLFDDPASRLLEDYALDRFQQRQNPDPNSGTAMFEQYAKELINTLKGPVYSANDEAVLKGKAIDGIERERSATKQRWMEELSRRRIAPSSGIALDGILRIDEYFNQARNTFETQFAADAIQQTRQQRFQVLDTTGQLANSEESRLREALTYASIPKQLQDNAFQQGLQLVGAGGSPQSILNSALAIAQMGQQQGMYNSQRQSQLAGGLLQYLGYLFG